MDNEKKIMTNLELITELNKTGTLNIAKCYEAPNYLTFLYDTEIKKIMILTDAEIYAGEVSLFFDGEGNCIKCFRGNCMKETYDYL